jgi:hypothetical protein
LRPLGAFALVAGLFVVQPGAPCRADEPGVSALAAVLEDCGELRLAAQGSHVKDKSFKVGHMEISFAEGTVASILGKSGTILGLYFEGRGGYAYTAADLTDRQAMQVNVARISKSLRPISGKISDEFKRVLVLFSEPEFGDVYDASEGDKTAPVGSLLSGFKEVLAGALNTYGEFDFRTAQVRLNEGGRWVYAEASGGLEHIGYVYDEVLDGRERLFCFRKFGGDVVRFSETLSYRSVPGWNAEIRTAVVLTKAAIDVATHDNRTGTIDSDMTFRVRWADTRLITLRLINNRDPETADWNSPNQKLVVKRVLDANGKALPFSHKYGELVVEIPPTRVADSDVQLRFETEGEVFLDMAGHHANNYFTLGIGDWYPSPTGWSGQRFTYTLKVRCKKPWEPVASGKQTLLRYEGDECITESHSDHPSTLLTVMAGKYEARAEMVDGVNVRVHAYSTGRKYVLENMPKVAAAMVKFYTSILGPMPAEELDIVEVPEYGYGLSPSGVVLLTIEKHTPYRDERADSSAREINVRLAHEIAHQWFAHKAIPADPSEVWISESFAEYFSGLAVSALAGSDKTRFNFSKMLLDWRAEDKYCANGAPIATASYLGGEQGWRDRQCLLYRRGPLVLHMLRTSIGDARFLAASKAFLESANDGPASTDDYAKAVSEVVQMDMRWYFDQWIRRSGNAQVDVEQHVEPGPGGQFRLWGTITQPPGEGFKKLLIPLVWQTGGKTEARLVFADRPETKFEFLLPTKPGSVKPDPFGNNLAVYK